MPVLAITQGYHEGATFRLGQRTLTLGRDAGNLVQVIDEQVSRRHAVIRWTGTGYRIEDLESRNGLFVNDVRATDQELGVGDTIRLGSTVLEVVPDRMMRENSGAHRGPVRDPRTLRTTRLVASAAVREAARQYEEDGGPRVVFHRMTDLDAAWQEQSDRMTDFLDSLDRLVESRSPAALCLDQVLGGVLRFLAPDRVYVFAPSTGGRMKSLVSRHGGNVTGDRRSARPHLEAISFAWHRNRPFILNSLATLPDPDGLLGSVAVLPIPGEHGAARAVLYLDSFVDNTQAFVEDDLEFLRRIAGMLAAILNRV